MVVVQIWDSVKIWYFFETGCRLKNVWRKAQVRSVKWWKSLNLDRDKIDNFTGNLSQNLLLCLKEARICQKIDCNECVEKSLNWFEKKTRFQTLFIAVNLMQLANVVWTWGCSLSNYLQESGCNCKKCAWENLTKFYTLMCNSSNFFQILLARDGCLSRLTTWACSIPPVPIDLFRWLIELGRNYI